MAPFAPELRDEIIGVGMAIRQGAFGLDDVNSAINDILMSIDTDDPDLQLEWYQQQAEVINIAKKAYGWALEKGIAKEQARAVLPEGIMDSRLYVNGTIRSWIHYVDLRSGNGTQKEHIEVAQQCALALKPIFPMIMEFCHGADKL